MLVAMNTEPLYNRQVHIGRVAMYALGPKGEVIHRELTCYGWFLSYISSRLVPLFGGRSSNQFPWLKVPAAFSTSASRRKVGDLQFQFDLNSVTPRFNRLH